ncbi:YbjQ family protein [Rhizobium binae]|uniref:YbjQ family protein n=1 Tax=Rhizobium lentis TaxID=1138194 RepID=UPI001C834CCE|nr:YbjQ family protein [Rhizobium lentis]MBX4941177.1 YbjQ family protein [Rhizobium binae]MBX4996700.1 YbjQ family protein [Rhizobium lentis]
MPNCSRCGNSYFLGSANNLCVDCEDLAQKEAKSKQLEAIILTTSIDVPNRKIDSVISIIAAEAALGMSIFRDIANNWRDFVGGRSTASQKSLREARLACLEELRREAVAVGADAVIAVDLDYNELSTSGSGGGILFVAASGTAVKLAPV